MTCAKARRIWPRRYDLCERNVESWLKMFFQCYKCCKSNVTGIQYQHAVCVCVAWAEGRGGEEEGDTDK
jgi:hypothetical protein